MPLSLNNSKDIVANSVSVIKGNETIDLLENADIKANTKNPAFTGPVTGVTKQHVGLGNVDNTSDAAKPVSSATQTELDKKAPLQSPTFTGLTTVADLKVANGVSTYNPF